MYRRIVLLALIMLVASDPKPCMWELEDCYKERPKHPDYFTNCYVEYSGIPKLCRRKCVGPRPFSPQCVGNCEEYIKECVDAVKTSTLAVPEGDVSLPQGNTLTSTNPTVRTETTKPELPNTSDDGLEVSNMNTPLTASRTIAVKSTQSASTVTESPPFPISSQKGTNGMTTASSTTSPRMTKTSKGLQTSPEPEIVRNSVSSIGDCTTPRTTAAPDTTQAWIPITVVSLIVISVLVVIIIFLVRRQGRGEQRILDDNNHETVAAKDNLMASVHYSAVNKDDTSDTESCILPV